MGRTEAALALLLAGLPACAGPVPPAPPGEARGVVFSDRNGNGRRDPLEWGVRGVAVSNGREVVRSDWRGRYALPLAEDEIVFVVKPRGYATPLSPEGLPRFHYAHEPRRSPDHLAFAGLDPTGPAPESIDFPLIPVDEPERFEAIVFGDTQPYTLEQLGFLSRDVIADLIGTEAAFLIVLGDLVGDDLSLFEPLNQALGRLGVPWYPVIGNHDLDPGARSDADSDETYERFYGPPSYAFQYGRAHFVVLDDVVYRGPDRGDYSAGVSERQLEFLRGYLADVPLRDLVVLAMHIPLSAWPDAQRRELFGILARHPHGLTLSAHTHVLLNSFYGPERGFPGDRPHHELNVGAVAGSWYLGARDEVGLPHATMRDGAPNGWVSLRIAGSDYSARFQAARRPATYQMNIWAPDSVPARSVEGTRVVVNLFAGSERARVEMRLGDAGTWQPLARTVGKDPGYAALAAREEPLGDLGSPRPIDSAHLWVGALGAAPPGTHVLTVRATDQFGQVHTAHRLIRVE